MGFQVNIFSHGKQSGDLIVTAAHDIFTDQYQIYEAKKSYNLKLTFSFNDVNFKDYDGLWVPGGRAPEFLRQNQKVLEIVRYFIDQGKPIAAVCHGVQLLISADALHNRQVTAWGGIEQDCKNAGANFQSTKTPEDCVVDGNIVTGESQHSCPEMIKRFSELLGCKLSIQ